jgi:7-carboxy-7-deazaguanine synthase (Cx14CxxC type)
MSYTVKEIFLTLQGEGARAGRRAVFVRFAGCNLWSGRERDRAKAACTFCDTDFVGGRRYTLEELVAEVRELWGTAPAPYVVLTGGEPMLQIDALLTAALHAENFEIAIETNGTFPVEPAIDWICVSPKAGTKVVQRSGHELKLVYPQSGADPEDFAGWSFDNFFLQPMDGPQREANTAAAIQRCIEDGRWRLSVQTHKMVGIR